MIKHIEFVEPSEHFKNYTDDNNPLHKLGPLAQINFFIGANNSGKSRFIRSLAREFYSYDPRFECRISFHGEHYHIGILEIEKQKVLRLIRRHLEFIGGHFSDVGRDGAVKHYLPNKKFLNEHDLAKMLSSITTQVMNFSESVITDFDERFAMIASLKAELEILKEKILPLTPMSGKKFSVTYIPVLRSLRRLYESKEKTQGIESFKELRFDNFQQIGKDSLKIRTLLDHFIEKDEYGSKDDQPSYFVNFGAEDIFSGEGLYEEVRSLMNGKESKRAVLAGFEDFLSTSFFNGQKVEVRSISDERGEEVHIKIGDENEFPIYQLGDGIQAIILLTFPIFLNQHNEHHLVLCEEPELYLHPGMQRIFIEVMRRFPKMQFFIATHSNHFLDTTIDYPDDVAIFSFEKKLQMKEAHFRIDRLSSPGLPILNLLGVRNSSVFLSNCTIWVEGISDRIYLRRYLELYMEHLGRGKLRFSEDLHFAFLEFGGNNVVHYDFSDEPKLSEAIRASRVANRIFLIHDADTGKDQRHELLFHQLGDNYHKLPVLEIENLLSPEVLKATLTAYKKVASAELGFGEVPVETFPTQSIGEIVKAMISKGEIKKIFTDDGKLYNKAEFARTATSYMHHWNDLSTGAQKLTEGVYAFIKKHNLP
ncbi:AAA family ATPase [Mucilaginibacter angelicae]|uniref:AAA family ATPase n=1 Tax=Mucilaginibacter angelicae TaxID=869718 RepID=A0ABV6L052_9SPHI